MLFWMTSKVFFKYFLEIEDDKDILDCQYVLVSNRIRVKDRKHTNNVVNMSATLFPAGQVIMAYGVEEMKKEYMKQLKSARSLIATIIKAAVVHDYNIVFLCEEKEMKLKFMPWLSSYIEKEFKIPVYRYEEWITESAHEVKFDKMQTYAICEKILSKDKIKTAKRHNDTSSLSKSELKKMLKKRDLYCEGMSKKEMKDILDDVL